MMHRAPATDVCFVSGPGGAYVRTETARGKGGAAGFYVLGVVRLAVSDEGVDSSHDHRQQLPHGKQGRGASRGMVGVEDS